MGKRYRSILFLLISIFIISCDSNPESIKLVISDDVKKLIHFVGEEKGQTVILFTQGGPEFTLRTEQFEKIFETINKKNLLIASVHQIQTLNSESFLKKDITFEEAKKYDAESIKILYKVIKYFKNQNRTVYLAGGSFGAFIIQELIAKKGKYIADKYLILVGRLNFNMKYLEAMKQGKLGTFKNGTILEIDDTRQNSVEIRNAFMLAAGLMQNRYTEIFSKYNDLSDITYIYGKNDEALGRLNDDEVQFLKSRKVTIIAGKEGHHETSKDYALKGMKIAFGIE